MQLPPTAKTPVFRRFRLEITVEPPKIAYFPWNSAIKITELYEN